MAQALIWSHEALDDIHRIAEYINRDSSYHAQQVVERLFDLADELPAHPKLGRIVPELADTSEEAALRLTEQIRQHLLPECGKQRVGQISVLERLSRITWYNAARQTPMLAHASY